MKKFFFNSDGSPKVGIFLVMFLFFTGIGIFGLNKEILFNLSHNFFAAGIFEVICPIIGVLVFILGINKYKALKIQATQVAIYFGVGALIFWAGLFGPAVALAANRGSAIPDVAIYYSNGKVLNPTDSSKEDYYFKHIKLNTIDSLYVITYGEEPGYNKTNSQVRNGDLPQSSAPRANEDWTRPNPIETRTDY